MQHWACKSMVLALFPRLLTLVLCCQMKYSKISLSLISLVSLYISLVEIKRQFCYPAAKKHWPQELLFQQNVIGFASPDLQVSDHQHLTWSLWLLLSFLGLASYGSFLHISLELPCAVLAYVSELGQKLLPGSFQSELLLLGHLWGKREIWLNMGKSNQTQCDYTWICLKVSWFFRWFKTIKLSKGRYASLLNLIFIALDAFDLHLSFPCLFMLFHVFLQSRL